MSYFFEYENGELIREGYVGESTCPLCGYPTVAIFYEDGSVDAEICDFCKNNAFFKRTI